MYALEQLDEHEKTLKEFGVVGNALDTNFKIYLNDDFKLWRPFAILSTAISNIKPPIFHLEKYEMRKKKETEQ